MRRRLQIFAVLALALVALPARSQEESTSDWAQAVNSTTPFPIGERTEQEKGWWSGAWDGTKRIWREGGHDLYLSGYYWHSPVWYSAEQRSKYSDTAFGLGYGRTLTDEKDNQRMLFAIVAQDSLRKPMYLAGYAWLARWRIGDEGFRVGAGYSVTVISHSSLDYIPVPFPTPMLSLGTDRVSAFATWVGGVTYFFGKISF